MSETLPPEVKGTKTICIPCSDSEYEKIVDDRDAFRKYIVRLYSVYPELFPISMCDGFVFNGFQPISAKLSIRIRRILIGHEKESFSVRPSFAMPYMTAFTEDVEKALFLRRFDVPFWGITYVFGRDDMYWQRVENSFGRYSIVGTTVKNPVNLPKDVVADEKHSKRKGEKVYVLMTVGNGVILGAAVSSSASANDLTVAYREFADEAKNVDPDYKPETVNTDGWDATQKAWLKIFPGITMVLCFLHSFLSIKQRCSKKLRKLYFEIGDRVWEIYRAETKKSFSQRIRRLREWADKNVKNDIVLSKILALCNKKDRFIVAYDHPDAHRTSNMLDRLMRWMDEYLFNRKYFHGTFESAKLTIRAWALLRNFQPYCPRALGDNTDLVSAAEKLNGFRYSDNWLENLLISASMGGYRQ